MSQVQVDLTELRRTSARSGAIALSAQLAISVSQLAAVVVLARLLSPADFGIVGMVTAVTAVATILRDLGLSTAVVQAPALSHEQQSTLYWLNVGCGLGLSFSMAAVAPLVGLLYGEPRATPVMVLLSCNFFVASLGTQHAALLQREMAFSRKAAANVGGAVATVIVAVVLARCGFGYWALAWGTVAGAGTSSAMLFALSDFRPAKCFSIASVRDVLGFGSHVVAFDVANYFHRNFDNILVGRFIGADGLGIYTRAYQLSTLPITLVRNPIMAVALPALSRLAMHPDSYRLYFKRIANLLAFLTMPLMAFMAATAESIITLALGSRWVDAAVPFALLSIAGFVQPVAGLRGTVMLSSGYSRRYVHWGVVNAACMVVGFLLGIRWGLVGVSLSYALVANAILWPSLLMAFRGTPLRPADFFTAVGRPACASIAAACACRGATLVWSDLQPWAAVGAMAGIFLFVFFVAFAISPGGIAELRQTWRLASGLLRKGNTAIMDVPPTARGLS